MEAEFKQAESRPSGGLEDGGHIFLDCSDCGKKLVDIWIQRPSEHIKFKYRASCPYCGDESFSKEISGGIAFGGIAENPEDEDSKMLTIVENFESKDGYWLFNVRKA